jgi:YnbE-like lipoprotein
MTGRQVTEGQVRARLTPPREEARLAVQVAAAAQPTEQAMPGAATRRYAVSLALATGVALAAAACTPTVRIEASDKPITINLNVKIDQEIRYRLDKDLEDTIAANPNLF